MEYQGGGGRPPSLHNGYWPNNDPPKANGYSSPLQGQSSRVSNAPNGNHSQYQPPTPSSAYVGQGQYWNQYAQPHHTQGRAASYPAFNENPTQSPTHAPIHTPIHAPLPIPTRQQSPKYVQSPQSRPQVSHGNQARQGQAQSQTHDQSQIQPHSQPQQQPQTAPQFISPAQLFEQPAHTQTLPQYMSPQQMFKPPRTAASNTSARMVSTSADVESDLPNLLISLAEEYFEAAHKLAPSIAGSMFPENVDAYQKLIATGLGCLETALKNAKLSPRIEANIRLRYAGMLYEETENCMEAETALSKGIALCERVG